MSWQNQVRGNPAAEYAALMQARTADEAGGGAAPMQDQDLDDEIKCRPRLAGRQHGLTAARETFGKMREGRFSMFAIKGESPSNLRVAEVLKKYEELVKIWYDADRTMRNYDNAEMTPGLRRLVPEWYDKGTG